MAVIRSAAKRLGSPRDTACQLTIARQVNAPQSIRVVTAAAIKGNTRPPFSIQIPQSALSPPNTLPEIRAVLAAAGLDA